MPAGIVLAIKHAQDIPAEPVFAVSAQIIQAARELVLQENPECLLVGDAAKAIQSDPVSRDPQGLKQRISKNDYLCVYAGAIRTDRLAADMMKLAQPPLLRTFGAEHRPHIVQFDESLLFIKIILDIRPNDRRGAFGPQGIYIVLALDQEHLFLNYFSGLTQGSVEQRFVLQKRSPDFAVVMAGKKTAAYILDILPTFSFSRQNIPGAGNAFEHGKRL